MLDESVPEYLYGDCENIGVMLDIIISDMINNIENGKMRLDMYSEKAAYSQLTHYRISCDKVYYDSEQLSEVRNTLSGGFTNSNRMTDNYMTDFSYVGFILRNLNGSITVDSDEKNGTVFTIKIPQLEVKEQIENDK